MTVRFALIGTGRVGPAVARALYEKGHELTAVIGRTLQAPREACFFIGCNTDLATTDLNAAGTADLIMLAVPDDAIASIAYQLHSNHVVKSGTVMLHFSGSQPSSIMAGSQHQAQLFSLHPLLPFADRRQAYEHLKQTPYIGEGDETARPIVESLCTALGGQLLNISPDKKRLYHAAACIASNFFVTLIAAATELLQECDIDSDQGIALLLPLLEATLKNVATAGTLQGLTGPVVRGDTGTVAAHMQALKHDHSDLLDLYCILGSRTVHLAEASGRLDKEKAKEMRKLFDKNCLTNKRT